MCRPLAHLLEVVEQHGPLAHVWRAAGPATRKCVDMWGQRPHAHEAVGPPF